MRKKVILVSLDALAGKEYDLVKDLPGFGKMIREGAYCDKERSVFPTLTFCCHASIATGCTPGHHGIVHNYLLEPDSNVDHWNFYVSNLKRRAIWDYANDAGKKVLSMSWPVSAGADILWSMPEMTPAKPKIWKDEIFAEQMQIFHDYGNEAFAKEVFDANEDLIKHWFTGKQPDLDKSMLHAFFQEVHKKDFDIAMLHVFGMDNDKHVYGPDSDIAHGYLKIYDEFIQKLLQYSDEMKAKGEDVTVMITGDHSQKPIHSCMFGNEVLANEGYAVWDNDVISSCSAYFQGGYGMAYLYIFDKENKEQILEECKVLFAKNPAINRIMEKDEFIPLGGDQNADLAFEAAEGYSLEGKKAKQPLDAFGIGETLEDLGTHGYLPEDSNYYTMFLAYGPSVQHTAIEKMSIMDIVPSICKWMDMDADEMDGKSVEGLF